MLRIMAFFIGYVFTIRTLVGFIWNIFTFVSFMAYRCHMLCIIRFILRRIIANVAFVCNRICAFRHTIYKIEIILSNGERRSGEIHIC
jgi:hypothetical protein